MIRKRLLSACLALALCLSLLPATALAAGEHDSHSNDWTEFTAGTTTLSGGSYYLSGDVEYYGTESITVSGEVILCLNDHKLDLKGQHISVGSGASLTLCDCSTGGVLTGGSGSNGGGVYVGGGGTFTMTGGSIAGNTANAGGGVYVDEGGTFTMEDGSINNNQATSGGGGGVMVNKGSFTLSGGSITGNTTNSDTFGYGGGVCLYGTFYLSGDSIIQNNTKAGATDNLYLGWNTIKITGPLGENARIGVTAENVPRSFISGWSNNMVGENPADYFSSDGDACGIGLNADGDVVLGSLCTTITLNPNGGALPEYSLVAGAALPIPTKTGYTFAGWYDNEALSGSPVTAIPATDTGNKTYYAKWLSTDAGVASVSVNGVAGNISGNQITVTLPPNSVLPDGTDDIIITPAAKAVYSNPTISTDTESVTYTFTVTAEDGQTTADYTVTVTVTEPEPTPPPYIPPTYAVTTPETTGGTVRVSPSRASRGTTVTITVTPDEGFALASLAVTDFFGNQVDISRNSDGTYSFVMPASQVTVSAVFAPAQLPFTDVTEANWYYDEVYYVWANGLMQGTSAATFGPNVDTTRAMVVTILWRLEGEPASGYDMDYSDVAGGAWYAGAVRWATEHGIVNGSEGQFYPGGTVTREQLAAMLYRYAQYKGYDLTAGGDLSGFADAGAVSGWAETSLAWAVGQGLLQGSDSQVDPQGSAIRAQTAAILMRFCENMLE